MKCHRFIFYFLSKKKYRFDAQSIQYLSNWSYLTSVKELDITSLSTPNDDDVSIPLTKMKNDYAPKVSNSLVLLLLWKWKSIRVSEKKKKGDKQR